eukprot:gene14201-22523_t
MHDAARTAAAFDDAGWLRTGDTEGGADGYYRITGRIKELIITAGGENVPPAEVNTVRQKMLVVLLTLKQLPGEET